MTTTEPKLHFATSETPSKPCPRKPHRGRYRKPIRRSGTMSAAAWSAMDRVAVPARIAIISAVQSPGSARTGSPAATNQPRPPMATTLATSGAQVKAAKRPLALRTWPKIVNSP